MIIFSHAMQPEEHPPGEPFEWACGQELPAPRHLPFDPGDMTPCGHGQCGTPSIGLLGGLAGKPVFLESYGCTYNERDKEMLEAVLVFQGCRIVSDPRDAEVVVLNTCAVTGRTERAMLKRMRACGDRMVVVTGCLPLVRMGAVRTAGNPVVLHPDDIRTAYFQSGLSAPARTGVVQVASGCLGRCSYCITRFARGPLRSVPPRQVFLEVRNAVSHGAAEIRLTAQDVSAYGRDTGYLLPRLLSGVAALPGNFMVRVGMMNPATVIPQLDDLVDAMSLPGIFRFLHLPVQSGSARVLRAMDRGYTPQEVIRIVERFREKMPDLFFMTDVICGFPGETDGEFGETVDLIRLLRPDKVNVTRFSKRPKTRASDLSDFPDRIKKERSRMVQKTAESVYREKNAGEIGKVVLVVVTEVVRAGSVMARTEAYRGVVVPGDYPPGTRMHVRILTDRTYFFTGEKV